MPTPDPGTIAAMAAQSVGGLVNALEPGAFVTRFALVAEVVDVHGNRALWHSDAPDAQPWDTLGLLDYYQAMLRAKVHPA